MWSEKEETWLARSPSWGNTDPINDWKHQKRSLGDWFHQLVRPADAPRMCAYCDGSLTEQSRETVDHFLPRDPFVAQPFSGLRPLQQPIQTRAVVVSTRQAGH